MCSYDPVTVVFRGSSGKIPTAKQKGYLCAYFKGKIHRVHRIAWYLTYGYWDEFIDHIDGNKLNNKIDNLREVTYSQNNINKDKYSNNKSGVKGVYRQNRSNKWRVQVTVDGIVRTWDSIESLELAELIAKEARSKYQGKYARN